MTIDNERPVSNTQIFDTLLELKDSGLVAASGPAQVSGSDKILDLGLGKVKGNVIIDVSAIEVASGDEVYGLIAQFTNSATAASELVSGNILELGADVSNIRSADSDVGRYELPFTNVINGTHYRYMRLYNRVSGTVASGINYKAFVAKH